MFSRFQTVCFISQDLPIFIMLEGLPFVGQYAAQFGSLQEFIAWGGLLLLILIVFAETGLLFGFFLPGDSLLFTAGLLAAAGLFDIRILIPALIIAAILGDSVGYWTGKHLGRRLFHEKSKLFKHEHIMKTEKFYEEHGAKTIVFARFIPIIRTFAPIVAGIGHMQYRKFLTYNILGGVLWVTLMVSAGYWLVRLVPGIEGYLHYVILGIIVLSLIPVAIEYWKSRAGAPTRH
jgi:membrane-associated protein